MRRILPIALMSVCIVSSAFATDYTDKTYLSKRTHLDNLAMEFTTWHKQVARQDHEKKDRIGGTAQAVLFYEKSKNDEDLGKYFGTTYKGEDCSLCCVQDFIGVSPAENEGTTGKSYQTNDLAPLTSREVLHDPANIFGSTEFVAKNKIRDRIQLRPEVTSYGVKLDYHQKLDKLVKGLYFKASLPIVHVEHKLNAKSVTSTGCKTSCGSTCETGCDTSCDSGKCSLSSYTAVKGASPDLTQTCSYSLLDYLSGKVTTSMQSALTKAKWLDSDETGIADIELLLGYNLWTEADKHLGGYLGLIIPTGNTPDGEKLFEAVLGNGGHWAFVLGADGGFEIWKDTDKSVDLSFGLKYKYLFNATEKRTLTYTHSGMEATTGAVSCYDCKVSSWNQYLLGQCEDATGKIFPLANVLTQNVKVTPGHQLEGLAALTFNYKTWVFDLGYNLFAREAEEVTVKSWGYSACGSSCDTACESSCDPCATSCSGSKYAPVKLDYNTTDKFKIDTLANAGLSRGWAIAKEHLQTASAETPSVITHKLFGGIGYEFTEWKYPVILGIGGSYEWVSDNDALEQWGLWAKLGLTF